MKAVEIVQLIKTTLSRRGLGKEESDPVRVIIQYWEMNGTLLFEIDTFTNEVTYFNPEPF